MSATPEQIAERLEARSAYWNRHGSHDPEYFGYFDANDAAMLNEAAALIRAQSEREKVLLEKLEKIAGEAPAKEPRDGPTVGPPPDWIDDLYERVADMVQDAFDEGHARACWELGQIADAALKAAP